MRKRKNSFLLYSSLGLGIFILIIILGYFLTQSSYFLNFARKTLISQVNKQINGSIDIATIEGNIFTNLSLYNIVLSAKTSDSLKPEVISLKQLDLNYYLGSLLHKKIIISSILVSDLAINLHKDNQGTWNLAKIPIQKDSTKTDTTSSSWQIELEGLIVSNSKVNISGDNLPEQYPREISISQLISQASLGEELEWKLSKAELAVQPQEITISLNDLRGNDQLDFSLKLLEISSPKSQIQVTGNLINQPERYANLSFQANPLDFSELQTWLPSFPLQGKPDLTGQLVIHGDSLSSEFTMNLDKQEIILKAQLPDLTNPLTAYLDLTWKNINSNSWKKDLPESRLNGNLVAYLQGDTWPNVNTELTLKLQDSSFNSYKIYSFLLESKGSPKQLNNTLQVKSEFGEINTKADLDNLLGEIGYAISGTIKKLDILKLIPTFPYQSEINSQFNIAGKGVEADSLDIVFKMNFAGSSFDNKPIDALKLTGNFNQGNYDLKDMKISYDGLVFSAKGKGNIYEKHKLTYNLKLNSLPQIVHELQPDLALKGAVSGIVSGTLKDLTARTNIDLQNIKFQEYQLSSLTGESEVRLKDKKPEVDFTGSLTEIELPNLPVDSVWVNANYTSEKIFLDLNLIKSDTLGLSLTGDIFPSLKLANFTKLEINALGQKWQNKPDTLKINFNPKNISLHNLELISNSQTIVADFSLDSQESFDIIVKCDSLAIWPLRYLDPKLETINGKLSLNIVGKGELNKPQLSAIWNVDNLSLQDMNIRKIAGNIDYQNSIAQLDLEVNRATISLSGYLPFQADISTKEFQLLKDEPLNLELKITPFDLSNLNEYTNDVKDVKGNLNLTAKLENTFNHPLLNAKLLIKNAAFKLPTWGVDYRNINLDFEAHNNRLELKNFSLPSGKKGYLKINGSTVLNLKTTQLDSLEVSLNASNWQVLKNRDMDLMINSKLEIAGNSSYPTFSGYLNILRARLYLPTILGRDKKKMPLTTPLLLASSETSDSLDTTNPKKAKKPFQTIKNLRGNMTLSFPHNTWIKSKEMNVELGGELEIIKNSPDFTLSGNVMVVRGSYTLYGRRFNISSGNIYFQGESDLNPEISLVADYILRSSSQEKLTLSIQVTGRLQQPVIQFLLDDKPISEGDGVSYIVFGKSTAELSSGERNQIDSSGDDNLATQILVNQIASRVTSVLQNRLNLDVIEFKGDNNWRQAQIVVGKYLTNNLFLSYEKELSFGNNNEVVPEKITLEYELRRRLYLQATQGGDNATGVDLIWKYQK